MAEAKTVSPRNLITSFIDVVRTPERTDKIFNVISHPTLANLTSFEIVLEKFKSDPACADIISERFNQPWELQELIKLPEDTLGYVYAKHMLDHNLDVNYYQLVPGDSDHVYVQMRSRRTHDIWHTVTGFDTSHLGETGLQAYSYAQFHSRLSIVIICMFWLHACFFKPKTLPALVDATIRGFLMGQKSKALFAEKFELKWNTPLKEYRKELNIDPYESGSFLT